MYLINNNTTKNAITTPNKVYGIIYFLLSFFKLLYKFKNTNTNAKMISAITGFINANAKMLNNKIQIPATNNNNAIMIVLELFETTQRVKIRLCPYTTCKRGTRFGCIFCVLINNFNKTKQVYFTP